MDPVSSFPSSAADDVRATADPPAETVLWSAASPEVVPDELADAAIGFDAARAAAQTPVAPAEPASGR